jgi:alanine-synthesizing transaminase
MGWAANKPQAGMFVWAKLPDPLTKMGSMTFTHQLIKKAYGAAAPGEGFGEESEKDRFRSVKYAQIRLKS